MKLLRKQQLSMYSVIMGANYPSNEVRTLVKMQLFHKRQTPWTKEEKQFAIRLYYKSPTTCRFLRSLKIILPSVSTIRNWISVSKFKPGFPKKFISCLKFKVTTMQPQEKCCIVCFDEMRLMKKLEYSFSMDLIEGFEDFGTLGRTSSPAGEVLFFFFSKGLIPTAAGNCL